MSYVDSATVLRHRRRRLGLSQEALSQATGLSRATIARLEAGEVSPQRDTRWKLSSFLGLREDLLFGPIVDPAVRMDFREVSADELAEILRDADAAGQTAVAWAVPPTELARELDWPVDQFARQKARALVSLGVAIAELRRRHFLLGVEYDHGLSASAEVAVKIEIGTIPPEELE